MIAPNPPYQSQTIAILSEHNSEAIGFRKISVVGRRRDYFNRQLLHKTTIAQTPTLPFYQSLIIDERKGRKIETLTLTKF